jgi:deoxyribose-phosphate aldolase
MLTATNILNLIDLTSLNDNDTATNITNLCNNAHTEFGAVAAICIYSRFVPKAKQLLGSNSIKIATVVNFPHGSNDLELAKFETELALNRGADEIDMVLPYHELINGNDKIAGNMVRELKKICGTATLKVIIESGVLDSKDLIEKASLISIDNGADFIKTSTGKVKINATLPAAQIMLNVIKNTKAACGFKASGGVKTITEAFDYINLATNIMGEKWINAKNFRFGASSLLSSVIDSIKQIETKTDNSTNY